VLSKDKNFLGGKDEAHGCCDGVPAKLGAQLKDVDEVDFIALVAGG
jgi:molybdopterin converting factor small subunit